MTKNHDHGIVKSTNDLDCQNITLVRKMCSVSLFESEELVKQLKPLDLTQAGNKSWIDQVIEMIMKPILIDN